MVSMDGRLPRRLPKASPLGWEGRCQLAEGHWPPLLPVVMQLPAVLPISLPCRVLQGSPVPCCVADIARKRHKPGCDPPMHPLPVRMLCINLLHQMLSLHGTVAEPATRHWKTALWGNDLAWMLTKTSIQNLLRDAEIAGA